MKFNKQIRKLLLTITTNCIQRCQYCFVEKTGEVMNFDTAKKAVELLLTSPSREKILLLYGGEPLLCFNLLKKVIIFSTKRAKKLAKKLTIGLATNGILLKKENIDFLKDYDVRLAISIDGKKETHDKFRILKNGKGSFLKLSKNLPLVLKSIKKENLSALMGVHPLTIRKMYENFNYLTKMGFGSINIEPIQKIKWTKKQEKSFLTNLKKITTQVLKNINQKKFIFLNSINRELSHQDFSTLQYNWCPFTERIEVNPQGKIFFSLFLTSNIKNKDKYAIGNVKEGIFKRYQDCKFIPSSKTCRNCLKYNSIPIKGAEINKIRNLESLKAAKLIFEQAKQNPLFKEYIKKAKKRIAE